MKLKDMMKESFSTSVKIDLSASIMQNISKPAEQPKSKIKTLSMVVAAVAAVCILTLATMMSLHVDNDKIAGNEKLEEYVIEHVGGTVSDFNGEVEAVNLEK
jgi:signal transduction histidine kinase